MGQVVEHPGRYSHYRLFRSPAILTIRDQRLRMKPEAARAASRALPGRPAPLASVGAGVALGRTACYTDNRHEHVFLGDGVPAPLPAYMPCHSLSPQVPSLPGTLRGGDGRGVSQLVMYLRAKVITSISHLAGWPPSLFDRP